MSGNVFLKEGWRVVGGGVHVCAGWGGGMGMHARVSPAVTQTLPSSHDPNISPSPFCRVIIAGEELSSFVAVCWEEIC